MHEIFINRIFVYERICKEISGGAKYILVFLPLLLTEMKMISVYSLFSSQRMLLLIQTV